MSMAVVLVTGGFDQKIRFWEATTGSCIRSLRFGESQVNTVKISKDKLLVAAGGNPQICIYDVNSSHDLSLMTLDGHGQNVTGLGFQQDGKWVYSCSEDGTMKVWDMRTGSSQVSIDTRGALNSISLHPKETEIITGDQNGHVKVWDMTASACRTDFVPLPDVPVRSTSIVRVMIKPVLSLMVFVAQSRNGSTLAVGSHKGHVYIYKRGDENVSDQILCHLSHVIETQKADYTRHIDFKAHDTYLLKCMVSPDMNSVVTTSADHTIRQWGIGTSQQGEQMRCLTQHQRWVWDAVFSADSSYLVSASSDQSAKLWDLNLGEVIRNYMGHNLAVTCVDLNDNNL
jgi:target of rapamycin complex subunit LST8